MKILKHSDIMAIWHERSFDPVFPGIRFGDREYAMPTKKWFLKTAQRHAFERGPWRKAFNCDHFAFSLKIACQEKHAEVSKDVDGLAVGVCFYLDEKLGPHAINWSINRNGLYFVEPQTGKEKWLSKLELRFVGFVYV